MRFVNRNCERVRQWASLELDGELSSFELALLEAHVESCRSCGDFRAELGGFTRALRAAPHERFEGVSLGRVRRRVRMRLAPAAAAMAVAAVGLGSILASSSLRSGPVGRLAAGGVEINAASAAAAAAPDTMNLSTSKALQTRRARTISGIALRQAGSLRGGPVVSEHP